MGRRKSADRSGVVAAQRNDQKVRSAAGGGSGKSAPVGRLVAELADPFALEVHRPVTVGSVGAHLPDLPPYIRRPHDEELAQVVARAVGGRSAMAVLVGGSSTGKTRACWEAIHLLPPGWRLWHPIDPTRPEAVLAELPRVGPRTVVWLNETQLYLLDTPADTGERVAAALRAMLTDSRRAPVLVLGTLWAEFWDSLTARPAGAADPHAQARELLAGRDIPVPSVFTEPALQDLQRAAAADVRLAAAAAGAQDGQVTQFLAGVPELLARYRNAPTAAMALIRAAMDARRLGMRPALPQAFLEAAAPGYLTGTEWDALGEDWLEQALAYTAVPCKGVCGPLTRIRPRPAGSRPRRFSSPDSDEQLAGGQASSPGMPLYRFADYLDQLGRAHRKGQMPPAEFWTSAVDHAHPGDQAALAYAARARGLYQVAAQLFKNAIAHGDPNAGINLINLLHNLDPADHRPAQWVVTHVSLDHPRALADLLQELRQAGADEQVTALAERIAHAYLNRSPDAPDALFLLFALRKAGAQEQADLLDAGMTVSYDLGTPLPRRYDALASPLSALRDAGADGQALARVPLDDPYAVASLLRGLRKAGAQEHIAELAAHVAAHAPLDDPGAVAVLLGSLWHAGEHQQVTALAARIATGVSLDDPDAVARLLTETRKAGRPHVFSLHSAHVARDRQGALADLLDKLRQAGNEEDAAALADRAAAHAPVDHPAAVAVLLKDLRKAGAHQQVTVLAARDPAAHVSLDDLYAISGLLREAGAHQQATALADRAAAHVALDDPSAVASLLRQLRAADAGEQIAVLAARDPAAHVSLDDLYAISGLLKELREAGAHQQATALADRAAAHVALDDPSAVASLLRQLRAADAGEQIAVLAARDPAAHVSLDDLYAISGLLKELREAGAHQQATALADRAAAHVALDDPSAVASLLRQLRAADAGEQIAVLAARLPGAGMFKLFLGQEGYQDQFWFGREADGSPSKGWAWKDLD